MATYKRISGDYNIISIDPSAGDNVNIVTNTVNITGNLDVTGNVTYINVNDLTVDDPFITVAGNNAGNIATAPFQQQGLVAQTSANTFAGIRFDNGNLNWQASSNVYGNGAPISAYVTLATGNATPGGSTGAIQFNNGGTFGGNNNLRFDNANSYVYANVTQYIGYQATPPNLANAVALYSNVIGSGGTGLYFTSSSANDELVSKSAAIVFAIIF